MKWLDLYPTDVQMSSEDYRRRRTGVISVVSVNYRRWRISLNATHKHVVIIGAGVAGLTAADALAGRGIQVSLLEKTAFLGGHALQLSCKATDACVKCGACVVTDKLERVIRHPNVEIHTGTVIEAISNKRPYQIRCHSHAPLVDAGGRKGELTADAVLVATGFAPYDPSDKSYGYGRFQNVITSLDAERLLREKRLMKRPSDDRLAKRIAFIQCVGSRDARLGHPWCSKICCGSSLRMARLIQSRQEDAEITFFYIDVQTFGKDFQSFYGHARENIEMIRAIPGDIFRNDRDELEVIYFDPETGASREGLFDVVVLSVGLLPSGDNGRMAEILGLPLDEFGFIPLQGNDRHGVPAGIYTAGTVTGPMSIAESVSSAEKTVFDMIRYLGVK
ncbi:MAG: CoB--CoM heterodisulfide reductase iron-sulfur subunit A family protein [Deltaproteobacteria bacterium]|nr:CoB--CoM heterodisulfide reductase iron-sulfur subunit A family protein [Deltaproteobacteria bacterium]